MPIFEYDCESCGGRFDVLVRSKKDRDPACPDCGAKECRKAFSTFAMGGSREGPSASGGASSGGSGGASCSSCARSSCAGCR